MEHSIPDSGTLRSITRFSVNELRSHEEQFITAAKHILSLQKEVSELQKQLDHIMANTQKRESPYGHVVDFERILLLKQITDVLRPRRKVLRKEIKKLYWDLFPSEIFIEQHFFETWISIPPDWVVRFSYDLEEIEMEQEFAIP